MSRVTCQYVSELNLKNMYGRRPGTSTERPIIWSPGRPATRSCRRPHLEFCIFVFPVESSNRCVKQELLHLKNTFFIKLSSFLLVP